MSRVNTAQLGLDATQAINATRGLSRAFKKLNAEISSVRRVTQKLDESGNLIRATLQGMTRDGAEYRLIMQDFNRVFPTVTTTVNTVTQAFNKVREAQQRAVEVAREERIEIEANIRARDRAKASIQAGIQAVAAQVEQQKRLVEQQERAEREGILNVRSRAIQEQQRENIALQKQRFAAFERQRAIALQTARTIVRGHIDAARAANQPLIITDRLSKAARRANIDLSKIPTRFREIEQAANRAGQAARVSRQPAQDVLISWRSFGRLFIVQALHQSIALVRSQLAEAAREAKEFSKTVAAIRTISEDAINTTDAWTAALADFGSNLPFNQLEIAKAAYQALSDQIIHTTDDLGFLDSASKLAIVSVSDIETSVDALSSVTNAFNFSLLRTDAIAATLFATVDLGRANLEELGKNIGRVSILSKQLGITFDEQQAALATLSIQGLKENVAKTLLVNVYNKLLRPSERLKEILDKWGFSSGRAALAALGLGGVLEGLREEAKRTGDETSDLAEIFQRLRAVTGSLGLDTEKLRATMEESGEITKDFASDYQKALESTSIELDKQLAKLNAALLRFGQRVNEIIVSISKRFGGLDRIVRVFAVTIADLGALFVATRIIAFIRNLSAVLTVTETTAIAATAATGGLAATLAAAWPVALVVATVALVHFTAQWAFLEKSAKRAIDETLDEFDKLTKRIRVGADADLDRFLKSADRAFNGARRAVAILVAEIQKLITTTGGLEDLSDVFKNVENSIDTIDSDGINDVKESVRELKDELRDAEKAAKDAKKEIEDSKKQQVSIIKDIREREIISQNRGKPEGLLGEAFLDEGLRTGNVDFLEKAQRILENIAENDKATVQEKQRALAGVQKAETEILRIKRAELAAEQKAQQAAEQKQKNQEAVGRKAEKDLKKREAALKELEKAVERFDKFDLGKELEGTEKRLKQNKKLIEPEKGKQLTLKDELENKKRISKQFLDDLLQEQNVILGRAAAAGVDPEILRKQEKEFTQANNQLKKKFIQEQLQLELNARNASLEEQLKSIEDQQKKEEDILDKGRKRQDTEIKKSIENRAKLEVKFTQELQDLVLRSGAGKLAGKISQIRETLEALRQIDDQLNAERLQPDADLDQIQRILLRRLEIIQQLEDRLADSKLSAAPIEGGDSAFNVAQELNASTDTLLEVNQAQNAAAKRLQATVTELKKFENDLIKAGLLTPLKRATEQNTQTMDELIQALRGNINELRLLRDRITFEEGERSAVGGLIQGRGGLIQGRGGIDRIMTPLTRGEHVVNAQATRQFLPILTAINRGYVNGGRVQNIQFGDINVAGGSTNQETARSIVRHIKHEMQRGTLTLN